ncbi:hypothetical protein ACQ0MK_10325 [Thalassospira lucentensis]
MPLIRSEKTRRLLWFAALYIAGIITVGAAAMLLKALLGQA